jgi:hypothetical protein
VSDELKRQVAAWVADALAQVEPVDVVKAASMQGLARIEGDVVEIQRESLLVHRVRVRYVADALHRPVPIARTAHQGVRYFYVKVSEQL